MGNNPPVTQGDKGSGGPPVKAKAESFAGASTKMIRGRDDGPDRHEGDTVSLTPYYEGPGVQIFCGDCRDVLPSLAGISTCITDPPYGLGFMGKDWDHSVPGVHFWQLVLAALKPGAHLLAFGGTRLWHRLAVGVEDAGFEIRDTLMWLYGSGFPKSLDVAKAIDKASGNERGKRDAVKTGNAAMSGHNFERTPKGTPIAAEAKAVSGWGTALKPAWEPILLARKPLQGTVAANVQAHGTGALNIDECRIGSEQCGWNGGQNPNSFGGFSGPPGPPGPPGRWPANLILDEDSAALLDERGGASRFFYTSKASRSERERGIDGPAVLHGKSRGAAAAAARGEDYDNGDSGFNRTVRVRNDHPTVKPLDLMRWLCRLTKTPTGGIVLDPFMGSGTTLVAAREEFRPCIGIELDERYCEIAAQRLSQGVLDLTGPAA
jgi:site-specific DNA-methyltransferase (adenine-specific)